jgi:hypothetical protein
VMCILKAGPSMGPNPVTGKGIVQEKFALVPNGQEFSAPKIVIQSQADCFPEGRTIRMRDLHPPPISSTPHTSFSHR